MLVGRLAAASALAATLLILSSCSTPTAIVGVSVSPLTPYVNEIVLLEGAISGDVDTDDILEWEWSFGDGHTARGRQTWHQYRFHHEDDEGNVVPWTATLTATDSSGRRYIGTKSIFMQDKDLICLSGYYTRSATTGCADEATNRPEPAGAELAYKLDDVIVGWWDATGIGSFYLLAKLFYLSDTDEASCTWQIYSHGESRGNLPELVSTLPEDTRSVKQNASYFYGVGFPLRVEPATMLPGPGWYQFIATIISADNQYTDVIDFVVHVGG